MSAPTFTTLQIAAVLDAQPSPPQKAKRRARRLMLSAQGGIRRRDHHGQLAMAWPVAGFPDELRQRLQRLAQASGHPGIEELILDQTGPWCPPYPLTEILERQVHQAEARCNTLSPFMGRVSSEPLAVVIRAAMPVVLGNFSLRGTTDRVVRQWIDRAVRRDRNREEWSRVELYLDESIAPRKAVFLDSQSEVASREGILLDLCQSIAAQLRAGGQASAAFNAARKVLRAQPGYASLSADAARKALIRAWRKYEETQTIKDGREYSGRRSIAELVPEEDIQRIRRATAEGASNSQAWRMYAKSDRCPAPLKAAIEKKRTSKHNLPDRLMQFSMPTPEMVALSRGKREAELAGFTIPRDSTVVLVDGRRVPLEPGDVWELDDMDVNQPFWFQNPDGTDELAVRHGAGLSRQGLYASDLATGRWLGVMLVARDRSTYRASDILSFLHQLMSLYGMPRVGFRFEMGSWMSRLINEAEFSLATDDGRDKFTMQLATELGLTIKFASSAKAKGSIESGFGYLQRTLIHLVDSPSYGKTRGERRDDCVKIQRCRSGVVHPKDIGMALDQKIGRIADKV